MISFDRRQFLSLAGGAGAAAVLGTPVLAHAAGPAPADFDFIFFTDTHLEPELDGVKGCDMAFKHMRGMKADFAIQGGDHIIDGLAVPTTRSIGLFDIYDKTQQDLSVKVYHTIGNHDLLGVFPASGVAPTDPLYGKKYFEDHIGKLYYSFDHKGVHFIVLDSIGITPDRSYQGLVDAAQVQWLAADLKAQPAGAPIIVCTHMPLVSAVACYTPAPKVPRPWNGNTVSNAWEVIKLLESVNVLGVLQGHWHINERVDFHGVTYLTCGAVCGNWWHGTHMGTPEGYTVVSVRGGKMSTRYETYGFKTIDPKNT